YVVFRDHVLRRHVHDDDAQVDPHHLLDAGHDDDESRSLDLPEAAEEEDHATLVFLEHLDGAEHEEHDEEENDESELHREHHVVSSFAGPTASCSPSIATILNLSPARTGRVVRASQSSPCTRTWPRSAKSLSVTATLPSMCSRPPTTGCLRSRTAN